MSDAALKFTALVAIAWIATRGVGPANAIAARRLWLVALASPLLFLLTAIITPALPANLAPARFDVAAAAPVSAPAWLIGAATVLYAVVTAGLLLRTAAGWRKAARIVRASRPLSPVEERRLRELADAPRLALAESSLDGPVTAGIVRPIVLLPHDWRTLPERTLAAMLQHEAAHVRRRDPALALAGCLVHAAFWFTPAAAVARRESLRFAEAAADATAAASLGHEEYASALIGFAASRRLRGVPMLAASGTESSVARRVRLLLDELEFGRQPAARIRAAFAGVLVALALIAAIRIGSAEAAGAPDATPAPFDHASRHAARHGARHAH